MSPPQKKKKPVFNSKLLMDKSANFTSITDERLVSKMEGNPDC